MNDKLKTCPFCGGRARIEEVNYNVKNIGIINTPALDSIKTHYSVVCAECLASTGFFISKYMSVRMWNKRAEGDDDDLK